MSVNKYEGSTSIQAVYKSREVKDPKAVKIVHSLLQKSGNSHFSRPTVCVPANYTRKNIRRGN